jgi:predicted nucleic acid-binding protein
VKHRSPARRVFVDTSAFGAFLNEGDAEHRAAIAIANELARAHLRLLTTNFVVAETHALILSRAGRDLALRSLYRIDQGVEQIVRVAEEDEQRARWIIERYSDKDFSLTDAISFAVMERLGIGHAFTFDRHFAQYGFQIVGSGG